MFYPDDEDDGIDDRQPSRMHHVGSHQVTMMKRLAEAKAQMLKEIFFVTIQSLEQLERRNGDKLHRKQSLNINPNSELAHQALADILIALEGQLLVFYFHSRSAKNENLESFRSLLKSWKSERDGISQKKNVVDAYCNVFDAIFDGKKPKTKFSDKFMKEQGLKIDGKGMAHVIANTNRTQYETEKIDKEFRDGKRYYVNAIVPYVSPEEALDNIIHQKKRKKEIEMEVTSAIETIPTHNYTQNVYPPAPSRFDFEKQILPQKDNDPMDEDDFT